MTAAREAAGETRIGTVIVASALGTVFEWYDFFVYGTLAAVIGANFFPAANPALSLLISLASFGVGFGMRPLGAILFGILGDRLGRKYTFLATVLMMGGATAAIGLLPTYSQAGLLAPILLVTCRILQGLALGGEYGGAAIYVAEHAPPDRRGFYTSFIQAGVIGGFLLSLAVILCATTLVSPEAWAKWGWRVPFLLSLVLLAVSLWVRLKLHESPVFRAMQTDGTLARNPLRESFDSRAKLKRVAVALFGIAAGLTVVWYTAQFQALIFLQTALRIDDTAARLLVGVSGVINLGWFVLFGWLSDRIGRKPPILLGYGLTLIFLFPLFHWMAATANPGLANAIRTAPVAVTGSGCRYDPLATAGQATPCGRVLDQLSKRGVPFNTQAAGAAAAGAAPLLRVGTVAVDPADGARLDRVLAAAGYPVKKSVPSAKAAVAIVAAIALLGMFSGLCYGPVAALLVELFPARVRYTSLSVPYHLGTGYFGGFLPLVAKYIETRTGDPFAGLWYTEAVVALAFVVTLFGLPETAGRKLER